MSSGVIQRKFILLYSIIGIIVLPLILHAKQNEIRFEHINTQNGLIDPSVTNIIQDQQGFMWFATLTGLVKYDGYYFTNYTYDPSDSNSISYPYIWKLYIDREGFLWIGISLGGLNKLDLKTGRFTHYRHNPDNVNSLSSDEALELYEDKEGLLWIGTHGGGLNLFDRENERFIHFRHDPTDPNSLSSDNIRSMAEDRRSKGSVIWLGTTNGLDRFDYSKNKFTHYKHDPKDKNSLSNNRVNAIEVSPSSELWLGTANGLDRFDPESGQFTHYLHDPLDPNSLSNNNILCLREDSFGDLWIGTGDNVINRLISSPTDLSNGNDGTASHSKEHIPGQMPVFVHYRHEPSNPYSLSSSSQILDIYEDKAGSIWISHRRGGIDKFDRNMARFSNYRRIPGNSNSLSHDMVFDIYEDPAGILWVATQGGGLNKIDRERGGYTHYVRDPENSISIGSNYLQKIYPDPDSPGTLWIGATNGLYRFISTEERFIRYFKSGSVYDIAKDRYGIFWLGTRGKGIYKLNIRDRTFTNYRHDPADINSLSSDYVNTIHVDHSEADTVIWVATEAGLTRIDTRKEVFKQYHFNPADSSSISHFIAYTTHEDKAGDLWIGTPLDISRFDKETEKFTRYKPVSDILSPHLWTVAEDNHGILWWGSRNGLWRFDPKTGLFKRFTVDDGLQGNTLFSKPFFNNRTGELFVGGEGGLTSFYPNQIKDNPTIPPIILTSFKIFNKETELDTIITHKKELMLTHDQNVFSLRYAALNYINSGKNLYSYKMDGFDKDWVEAGNKTDVTYTNLNPGEYTFRVKGSNNDGVWNETGTSIGVTIAPPFWKTWWAYTLYILVIGASLYGAWRATLARARTLDEVKLRSLEAEKLQELDQLKSRFFANISHEFRTPLTLILGPIDKMLTHFKDSEWGQDLTLMKKHARRVLDLVAQLLDLSRLEADRMKLQASRQNIVFVLKGLVQSFASMADRRNIALTFNTAPEEIQAYVDKDAIVKIMNNLLTNAFKFTQAGGKIQVHGTTKRESDLSTEGELNIAISDTGIGIPADRIDQIFDRFYQVDSSETREGEGTGIGLALTRELVELHKGCIEVESKESEGTTFTIRLPLGRAHLSTQEIVEASAAQEEDASVDLTIREEEEKSAPPTTRKSLPLLLIVEDNADVRSYIRSYLDEEFRCIESRDGEEGLKQAIKRIPDLILSDIMMPKMDGIEFCERIKTDERTSHIPVILLTAKADMDSKLEGLETGVDDYLAKPFEAAELQVRIRNLIEQRRRLREQFGRETVLHPKDITVTSTDERLLQRALDAVERHMSDDTYSVEEFSKEVGMSRANLHRKLRALTNHSASEFIRTLRLTRAAQLLKQNFGSVSEVAFEVGFSNPTYFSKCFRAQFGKQPSKYASLPPA